MKKTLRLLLPLLFFLVSYGLQAQIIIRNDTTGGIQACGGQLFLDSGGEAGGYGDNEDYTITICSSDPSKNHVAIAFDALDLAPGDELCFYDGIGTSPSTLLVCSSDFGATQSTIIETTIRNGSGCMTIRFRSNGSGTASGWLARVLCIPSCQTIIAKIDSTVPLITPRDTGWIDACVNGTAVSFVGKGIYPYDGYSYRQSDTLSRFEWNFGDGSPVAYGPRVNHVFTKAGGFNVTLTITDTAGCKNSNYIKQRVRISPRPTFTTGAVPEQVCSGAEIKLKGKSNAVDSTFQVSATTDSASFQIGQTRSETLFIPDDPSDQYKTSVFFTDFAPGQTLSSINDLTRVFVNMEHSYARDIQIKLVCPNGQSVILHKYDVTDRGRNRIRIGTPNTTDAGGAGRNDPNQNPPGVGALYNWVPNASSLTTWRSTFTTGGTFNLPGGDYDSDEPLTQLIGCPLNGEWSLIVIDQFGADNGWIFSWGIDFARRLYPRLETFKPYIVDSRWVPNEATTVYQQDSIVARPRNAGVANFIYRVTDNFGCVFDTSVKVKVLPFTHPSCINCDNNKYSLNRFPDTSVCPVPGAGVVLRTSTTGNVNQSVIFEGYPNYVYNVAAHTATNPGFDTLNVSNIFMTTLTDPANQIDSICVDLGTYIGQFVDLVLIAPSGQSMKLKTFGSGGIGFPIKDIRFTATATRAITGAPGPLTGEYRPEQSFNNLIGATVNGNWRLGVAKLGGQGFDTLKRWSISFKSGSALKYTWTPPNSFLSCYTCAAPTARTRTPTTYIVTATDSLGCANRDTIVVTIRDSIAAPPVRIAALNFNQVVFAWDAVTGAVSYEVSVNGGPWVAPNGTLQHTVSGLAIGTNVELRVRAIGNASSCGAKISTITARTQACAASIGSGSNRRLIIDSILCKGGLSPAVNFAFASGAAPFTYIIDTVRQSSPYFANKVAAGVHRAIFIDGVGCTDSLEFVLGEPDSVRLALVGTPVLCNGTATGQIQVAASGGTPSYRYALNGSSTTQATPTFTNLPVGSYRVQVIDANGCERVDSVVLTQPAVLAATTRKADISCFGVGSGYAVTTPTGGTQPYRYAWNNGRTTDSIGGLAAGQYIVTITDANGCTKTDSVTIFQSAPLSTNVLRDTAKCFGDTARVVARAIGGAAPYTFTFDNGGLQTDSIGRGLRAGNHFVIIRDAFGCRDSVAFTIIEPTAVRVDSFSTTAVTCFGGTTGSARVFASGGNGNFAYLWPFNNATTSSITNVAAGRYAVQIRDAKGCLKTDTVTVATNPALSLQLAADSVSCFGTATGAVRVTAGGGVGSFTYALNGQAAQNSNIFSGLTAGRYIVQIADGAGCQKTDSIVVRQPDSLRLTASRSNVNCFGAATGAANATVLGGTLPYNYAWSNGATVANNTTLRAGTYRVTVTDAKGCIRTDSATITENARLVTAVARDSAKCFGDTARAVARVVGGVGPYIYRWDSQVASADSIGRGLFAGNHIVYITDALGCRDSATVTLLQPSRIVTDSFSVSNATCVGTATGSASVYVSGGTPGYSYLWLANNNTTRTLSNVLPGRYLVQIKDFNNCVRIDSVTIGSNAAVVVNSFNSTPILCNGDRNARVTVSVSGGTGRGTYNYVWSTTPAQTSDTLKNVGAGRYTVTVTDGNGCQTIKDTTLTEPTRLLASISNPKNASCAGYSDGEASPSVSGGTPFTNGSAYTYRWNDRANQTTLRATGLAAGTYTVTVTDANGCSDTANVVITEPSTRVNTVVTQTKQACYNQSSGEAQIIATGGVGNYTYRWSNLQTGVIATNLSQGKAFVTVTDGNGCQKLDSVTISTYDSIRAFISLVEPTCFNGKGSIKIDSLRGGAANGVMADFTFRWSTSPVYTTALAANISGDRTYTVTVTDRQNCSNVFSTFLPQPPRIQLSAAATAVRCFGGNDGEAQVNASGVNPIALFRWNDLGAQTTQRALQLKAGRYQVTVTDTKGCSVDTFVVVSEPVKLTLGSKGVQNTKCVGDSTGLITTRATGGVPNYTYRWSSGDSVANLNRLRAGTYVLTVTDANRCVLTDTFVVQSPTALDPEVSVSPVLCYGERNGTITVDPFGGTPPYQYSLDGRNYNGVNQMVALRAGGYDVFVKDANGCLWFDNVAIASPPQFTIDAGLDVTILLGQKVQLYVNARNNQGAVRYQWKAPYDSTLSCVNCPNPTANPYFTLTYGVFAIDSMGCRASDSVRVLVEKPRDVYVPTGFSPNGDGVNDVLVVRGRKGTTIKSFRLFDRLGELVYEVQDFKINDEGLGWDGSFRGQPLNSGKYVWVMEVIYLDGQVETLKGHTTLLR